MLYGSSQFAHFARWTSRATGHPAGGRRARSAPAPTELRQPAPTTVWRKRRLLRLRLDRWARCRGHAAGPGIAPRDAPAAPPLAWRGVKSLSFGKGNLCREVQCEHIQFGTFLSEQSAEPISTGCRYGTTLRCRWSRRRAYQAGRSRLLKPQSYPLAG